MRVFCCIFGSFFEFKFSVFSTPKVFLNAFFNRWNRTFQGITGVVRIDDNGDRDADYSLLDLGGLCGDGNELF